ncbi:uncharacterized protein KY384_008600 [Bacidia gigantensis]|uniref:uncharacterized protein n=1 Tax=Bacidia gigantensis TaxID=2732470 RepID=UPI001D03B259|nr:uncharacterized protein KY384_008600 [Bacidia gigantensis]KAG8527170.1 hypothetical protein KY384_008600 [Bacidia gigantensis]
MATQSSPPPGWPLSNPPSKPLPPAAPQPSYMAGRHPRENVDRSPPPQALYDMPKRRPLSSSQGNSMAGSARPPVPPKHQNWHVSQDEEPILERKASFETGDDAFMRQPLQEQLLQQAHPQRAPQSPQHAQQQFSPEVPQHIPQEAPPQAPRHIPQQFPSQAPQHASQQAPPQVPRHIPQQAPQQLPPRIPQPQAPASQQEYEQRRSRRKSSGPVPITHSLPLRPMITTEQQENIHQPQSGIISSGNSAGSRHASGSSFVNITGAEEREEQSPEPLHYHHQLFDPAHNRRRSAGSNTTSRSQGRRVSGDAPPVPTHGRRVSGDSLPIPSHGRLTPASAHLGAHLSRPVSSYSSISDGDPRRTLSPGNTSQARTPSPSRLSPDSRPMSFIDLLNVPYPQPPPAPTSFDNSQLRESVGQNATLLNTKKTLEMYRANVKKTNDPTIQYEFAIFMVNAAAEAANEPQSPNPDAALPSSPELLREARNILQKLSDRSYPFAQYYLADGYASGLFNKGVEDNDRAFNLFVAASKHGHAEAGYRAALCYEFGWGCRKDPTKAVQFFRQSASKNHPGAMSRLGRACLVGDLGLGNRYREGFKWLKRAAESADFQYNSAPYELGLLHETGYGDDIFRDESYAAQLFTQSADLGHVEANYRLGDAYEHGKLSCPRDPALSVHFYTGAAQQGHPLAMMALCAWYMVGAEPVLDKDENEACEWARRAAETGESPHVVSPSFSPSLLFPPYDLPTNPTLTSKPGLTKAQYALGYFTEMGIGCRRDPLEANVWYVRAADQGDDRAKQRIAAIRAAASGGPAQSGAGGMGESNAAAAGVRKGSSSGAGGGGGVKEGAGGGGKEEKGGKKRWGLF